MKSPVRSMSRSCCFGVFLTILIASTAYSQATGVSPVSDASVQPTPVETASVADAVMSSLRDRDLPNALQELGGVVDRPVSIRDLVYSDLPSAAGGLFRAFAQESTDEQYESWESWTLPEPGRDEIRLLTVAVPTEAPPRVFARSIGERPRNSTFVTANVGPVPGLFCSGWMFVLAAEDLGRLSRLRGTLKELVDDDVPRAEPLWMLAQLAGSRGDLEQVNRYLQRKTAQNAEQSTELTPDEIHPLAVASAALLHPETQAAAEACLGELVERTGSGRGFGMRPFVRIAHAVAVQSYRGESAPEILFRNRFEHWVPSTVRSAKQVERGHPDGVWLTHEEHVLHLAGGDADVLFLKYPLVGDFDFIAETQEGSSIGTDGGLVYGGLHFEALGRTNQLTVRDADVVQSLVRHSPFARSGDGPVFNRVSIRSRGPDCQFESNFHPIWFDGPAARSSPWIGLRSVGSKRPVFRNIQLTGSPEIPKEVDLIAADQLRGWEASFYQESLPPFAEARDDVVGTFQDSFDPPWDWASQEGQLVGRAQDDADAADQPGLLRYQRPLLEGESVTYEWMLDGDNANVHPAIGRLAFLLDASGTRVRWLTTGQSEWTGLAPDNTALEPLNRRGPKPLPFKAAEWNEVRVERAEGKILVRLNGELIYQRDVETPQDTRFGLYRPDRKQGVRIRNVIMRGPWPDAVPESLLR